MLGWGQHTGSTRKDEALTRACMKNKYLGIAFSPGIRTDKDVARILAVLNRAHQYIQHSDSRSDQIAQLMVHDPK